ncbi:hypothetical protein ACGF0J_03460 [Nonomuraea sp. NPDC047897]|uniref:hypothetical protein n=1 Tax=Nonomuraea sp. NPDC047897 TaxID=3364346 RepID=UPI0037218218
MSGPMTPWATLKLKYTRSPSRVPWGSGYSVVMGLAWVSQSRPAPSIAHSVSCGAP